MSPSQEQQLGGLSPQSDPGEEKEFVPSLKLKRSSSDSRLSEEGYVTSSGSVSRSTFIGESYRNGTDERPRGALHQASAQTASPS